MAMLRIWPATAPPGPVFTMLPNLLARVSSPRPLQLLMSTKTGAGPVPPVGKERAMKASKTNLAILVLSALASCSVALAQDSPLQVPLSGLKDPNWEHRRAAYEEIKGNRAALNRPEVTRALVDLLDRENQVLHNTLVDSKGKVGVSTKYGEAYSEYHSDLLGVVEKIADWKDQRQLCILAEAPYEPDSPFAARLAAEGKAAVAPCLLKKAQGNMFDRHEAIPVLVQLSAVTSDLSPALQRQIYRAVMVGLRDPEVFVRQPTVETVGKYGTSEMIPILKDIAYSDPYSRPTLDGKQRFDVRDAAAKAIQSIQERGEGR
jgi:hypothetical protein